MAQNLTSYTHTDILVDLWYLGTCIILALGKLTIWACHVSQNDIIMYSLLISNEIILSGNIVMPGFHGSRKSFFLLENEPD